MVTIAGSGKGGHKDGKGKDAVFNAPSEILLSKDKKSLYVSDSWNICIRKISLIDGTTSTIAGVPGIQDFMRKRRETFLLLSLSSISL